MEDAIGIDLIRRYKALMNDAEIKNAYANVSRPNIQAFERQYLCGVIRGMELIKGYFNNPDFSDENGNLYGFTFDKALSIAKDVIERIENPPPAPKKGFKAFKKKDDFPSSFDDEAPF